MSSSNCCFLTCIQVSQEAGQVVWYSHLLQNFPQFIVIHPVKVFGIWILNLSYFSLYFVWEIYPCCHGYVNIYSQQLYSCSLFTVIALFIYCSTVWINHPLLFVEFYFFKSRCSAYSCSLNLKVFNFSRGTENIYIYCSDTWLYFLFSKTLLHCVSLLKWSPKQYFLTSPVILEHSLHWHIVKTP